MIGWRIYVDLILSTSGHVAFTLFRSDHYNIDWINPWLKITDSNINVAATCPSVSVLFWINWFPPKTTVENLQPIFGTNQTTALSYVRCQMSSCVGQGLRCQFSMQNIYSDIFSFKIFYTNTFGHLFMLKFSRMSHSVLRALPYVVLWRSRTPSLRARA